MPPLLPHLPPPKEKPIRNTGNKFWKNSMLVELVSKCMGSFIWLFKHRSYKANGQLCLKLISAPYPIWPLFCLPTSISQVQGSQVCLITPGSAGYVCVCVCVSMSMNTHTGVHASGGQKLIFGVFFNQPLILRQGLSRTRPGGPEGHGVSLSPHSQTAATPDSLAEGWSLHLEGKHFTKSLLQPNSSKEFNIQNHVLLLLKS